jgi:hypothetical protein
VISRKRGPFWRTASQTAAHRSVRRNNPTSRRVEYLRTSDIFCPIRGR